MASLDERQRAYLARLLAATERGGCLAELEAAPDAAAGAPLLQAMAQPDLGHSDFQRMGVLLMLVSYTSAEHPASTVGAACADGRLEAMYEADSAVARSLLTKSADELTADDAISYCCMHAWLQPACGSGMDEHFIAASGIASMVPGLLGIWSQKDPLSKGRFTTGDSSVPLRVAALILELLREPPGQRLPELARGGAAFALFLCVSIGPPQPHAGAVALSMVEQGIVELTAAEIEATLSAGLDWTSTQDNMVVGSAGMMVWSLTARIMSTVLTQSPESVAELRSRFCSSGLFQLSLEAMQRFADRGAEAAADGDAIALYFGLKIPNFVSPQRAPLLSSAICSPLILPRAAAVQGRARLRRADPSAGTRHRLLHGSGQQPLRHTQHGRHHQPGRVPARRKCLRP